MWQWQRKYIFDDLNHHNIDIEVLNPLHFSTYEKANEVLLKKIKSEHYDLLMTPHNEEVLFISTLLEIKKHGTPTLLFCPDSLLIPFHYKNCSKHYDLVWLTSPETSDLFRKWGANTIFLPFAANPNYYKPEFDNEINKVCFVGTLHSNRTKIINSLIDNDLGTTVFTKNNNVSNNSNIGKIIVRKNFKNTLNMLRYGVGRKLLMGSILNKLNKSTSLNLSNKSLEILPPLSFEQLPVIYSKYSLSLSTVTARHTSQLNKPVDFILLRNFEIPMSGGLQICRYSDELASYFEEGKEIVFYRDERELIDKSHYYLNEKHQSEKLSMKHAARKRAESEHTWYNRFEKVFDHFGLIV